MHSLLSGFAWDNRALSLRKTSEKPFKRGFIPAADLSFASETSFDRGVLLQTCERQRAENGKNFGSRSFPNSARILCKCYIKDMMLAVFDAPVRSKKIPMVADFRRQAADETALPFDLLAVDVACPIDRTEGLDTRPTQEDF